MTRALLRMIWPTSQPSQGRRRREERVFAVVVKTTVMEWTKQHDKALLGEMTISDLFQYKKGTPERGQLWDSIAGNLNAMDCPKFKVAKRSCRDRWTLLCTKYKRRMSEEIQATGIDAEVGELDEIIEDLIGREDAAIDSDKEGKKKAEADKKAAEEIRIKAMERFGKTTKRGGEDGEEGAKKKKRRSGSDAVEFLREKAKLEHSLREEELQLRKDQQSQTLLILQQQQQMNQALLTLMEKMLPKERN